MSARPGVAVLWLRLLTSLAAAITWGLVVPMTLGMHHVHTAGGDHHEDALAGVGVFLAALFAFLPMATAGALVLTRVLPRAATVALLGASATAFCLPVGPGGWAASAVVGLAVAVAAARVPAVGRCLPTKGQATKARLERFEAMQAAALRAAQPGPGTPPADVAPAATEDGAASAEVEPAAD